MSRFKRNCNDDCFWMSSFGAFITVGAIAAVFFFGDIESCSIRRNPAFTDFQTQRKSYTLWMEAYGEGYQERLFEEALAGLRPIEDLQDAKLEQVVRMLRASKQEILGKQQQQPQNVQGWVHRLQSKDTTPPYLHEWQRHTYKEGKDFYYFDPPFQALSNPWRLEQLLLENREGVLDTLPNLPTELQTLRDLPKPPEALPRSTSLLIVEIMSFSALFTLFFHFFAWDKREKDNSLPCATTVWPESLWGWLVVAMNAPTFLPFRFLSRSITSFHLPWGQDKEEAELEACIQRLTDLEERAKDCNDHSAVERARRILREAIELRRTQKALPIHMALEAEEAALDIKRGNATELTEQFKKAE